MNRFRTKTGYCEPVLTESSEFLSTVYKESKSQNSIRGEARNLVEESETFGRGTLDTCSSGNTFRPGARLSSDSKTKSLGHLDTNRDTASLRSFVPTVILSGH